MGEDFHRDNPLCIVLIAGALFLYALLVLFWPEKFWRPRRRMWSSRDADYEPSPTAGRVWGVFVILTILGGVGLYFTMQHDNALNARQETVFGNDDAIIDTGLVRTPPGYALPIKLRPYVIAADSDILDDVKGIPAGTDVFVVTEDPDVTHLVVEEFDDRIVVRAYSLCTEPTPSGEPSPSGAATSSIDCRGLPMRWSLDSHLLPVDLAAPLGARRAFDGANQTELAMA